MDTMDKNNRVAHCAVELVGFKELDKVFQSYPLRAVDTIANAELRKAIVAPYIGQYLK